MFLYCQHCGKKYSQPREYAITKHCRSDFLSNGFRDNITDTKKMEYLDSDHVDNSVLGQLLIDENVEISTRSQERIEQMSKDELLKFYLDTNVHAFLIDSEDVEFENRSEEVIKKIIKNYPKSIGDGFVGYMHELNENGDINLLFNSSYEYKDFIQQAICSKKLSADSMVKCFKMLNSSIERIGEFAASESSNLASQEVEEMDENGEFDDKDEKEDYQDKLEDEYYDDLCADYSYEVAEFVKSANINDKNMKDFYSSVSLSDLLSVDSGNVKYLIRSDFSFKSLSWLKDKAEEVARVDIDKEESVKKLVQLIIRHKNYDNANIIMKYF